MPCLKSKTNPVSIVHTDPKQTSFYISNICVRNKYLFRLGLETGYGHPNNIIRIIHKILVDKST